MEEVEVVCKLSVRASRSQANRKLVCGERFFSIHCADGLAKKKPRDGNILGISACQSEGMVGLEIVCRA